MQWREGAIERRCKQWKKNTMKRRCNEEICNEYNVQEREDEIKGRCNED